MDTTTVLAIIKMISVRNTQPSNMLDNHEQAMSINATSSLTKDVKHYLEGKKDAYEELLHHLQSFIEAELNKTEP